MKKNGILTLLFACIPGAGQMYQGYMKRGLSLITMFCLFIILGSTTGLDALVVGCIVVYMYSFFDTFNLRAQLAAEKAPEDDSSGVLFICLRLTWELRAVFCPVRAFPAGAGYR